MSFEKLVGNRALVSRLARMVRSGRVPPSLLFCGPSGVGKLQAAMTLAKALNCSQSKTDACGACPACLRIDREEHPDVHIARPEGAGRQLRADAVRQIVRETPFRPFEGRRRVSILVDADRMNDTAANKLLKTLEEPPPWVVLILITSNAASLLPTILSRCQIYRFAPLAIDELSELLVSEHDVDRDQATLLAALSGGRLTEALSYRDEPLTDLRQESVRLLTVVARGGRAQDLVPWADRLAKDKSLILLLHLLMGMARDVAATLAGGAIVHRDLKNELDELSQEAPLEAWLAAYQLTEVAVEDLRDRYLNKRLTVARLLAELRAALPGSKGCTSGL